ncbi:MAG: HAMP domain-containing protein [Nitrospirota bacterium]|nr:HAMP domain-containing protein [Nitrospirota bacterium]
MRVGLKHKIILAILGVGALPLVLGMVVAYSQGTTELERVIGGNFRALAGETARSIDLILSGEIARRTRIATNDDVAAALVARNKRYQGLSPPEVTDLLTRDVARWKSGGSLASDSRTAPAQEVLRRFAKTQGLGETPSDRSDRAALLTMFLTDQEGALVAGVGGRGPLRYLHRGQPWWRGAFNQGRGRVYLDNIAFDEALNSYVFTLAVPVLDEHRHRVIGVLQSVYDAKAFFQPAIHPVRFGKSGHVMLIDSHGTVIICPILPTGVRVSDTSLVRSVTKDEPGWVKADGDGHGGQDTSIIGFAPLPETSLTTKASTGVLWHSFAWQASDEIFAPTRSLLLWIASAGCLAMGLLGSIGYYAAHRIVTPIQRLQEGAARIGRGELTESITIRTGDEIERLADEFNAMNGRLQLAFAGLEEKVAAKTAEVRSLKEYNEKILNSLPESVMILRQDRTIEYINAEAMRVLNVAPRQGIGQDLFRLLPVDQPTQRRIEQEFDWARTAAPGLPTSRDANPQADRRDPLAPKAGDPASVALRDLRIGDRVFGQRFFRVSADGNGATRIGLALREVTAERRLQDQLIQAEKLAGLGTLTAGIAHEINNPLFVIMGMAQAMEDEDDLRVTKEYAQDIVKYSRHMASIIRNFAGYAAPGFAEDTQPVDVNQKLEDALKLARLAHMADDLEVVTDYGPVPAILARPEEAQQVFQNIIVNAIQAMNGHGRLSLSTGIEDGWIVIRIADTGPGIPKRFLGKIFDPFFTTKEPGKGTGLGLNIVYQIVTKYGGTVGVESEEGKGTRFTLRWPVESQA